MSPAHLMGLSLALGFVAALLLAFLPRGRAISFSSLSGPLLLAVAFGLQALAWWQPTTHSSSSHAWVLWMERPVGSDHWRLARTREVVFAKQSDCDEVAQGANTYQAPLRDEAAQRGETWRTALFTCLPDTVDPRGPKAR